MCPGRHLALSTMLYVLVRIFQQFKAVESRDKEPYRGKTGLVVTNASGYHVAFVPA